MGFRDPDPRSKNRASSLGSFYSLTKSSQNIAPTPPPSPTVLRCYKWSSKAEARWPTGQPPAQACPWLPRASASSTVKAGTLCRFVASIKRQHFILGGHGWWRLSLQEASDGSRSPAGKGQRLPTPSDGFPCTLCVLSGQLWAPQLSSGQGLQWWVAWGSGYREW